jgi:hypothetical protein
VRAVALPRHPRRAWRIPRVAPPYPLSRGVVPYPCAPLPPLPRRYRYGTPSPAGVRYWYGGAVPCRTPRAPAGVPCRSPAPPAPHGRGCPQGAPCYPSDADTPPHKKSRSRAFECFACCVLCSGYARKGPCKPRTRVPAAGWGDLSFRAFSRVCARFVPFRPEVPFRVFFVVLNVPDSRGLPQCRASLSG